VNATNAVTNEAAGPAAISRAIRRLKSFRCSGFDDMLPPRVSMVASDSWKFHLPARFWATNGPTANRDSVISTPQPTTAWPNSWQNVEIHSERSNSSSTSILPLFGSPCSTPHQAVAGSNIRPTRTWTMLTAFCIQACVPSPRFDRYSNSCTVGFTFRIFREKHQHRPTSAYWAATARPHGKKAILPP